MKNRFYFGAITDGSNGATVFLGDEICHTPAIMVEKEKLMDTNGAGDHFAAGFIYGLMHQFTLDESARLGILCATDCVSHTGARPLGGYESLKHLAASVKS